VLVYKLLELDPVKFLTVIMLKVVLRDKNHFVHFNTVKAIHNIEAHLGTEARIHDWFFAGCVTLDR
jgi:hypothetical protein